MAGAILLLLAGTQILDWYWVVLLAAASLGVGVYRLRKTIPSTYRLAQRIDRRLNLADALSTASYFSRTDARGDEAVRERQRQDAEQIARGVDVRAGVPFHRPRFAVPAIALAAVAFGLFALRYAVTGSLNLQPPLVKINFDTFFPVKQLAAKNRDPHNPMKPPDLDQGSPDSPTTQNEDTPETTLDPAEAPDEGNADAIDQSKSASKTGKQSDKTDPQGENKDKSDKSAAPSDQNQDDSKDGDSKDGKQQGGKDAKQGQGNESSSMLDKLRDAVANMMNKMKSEPKEGQQPSQDSKNGEQSSQQDKSNKGQPSDRNDPNANAQSDQQSEGADKSSADARGQEKGSDKNASPDSKSGIGSADGDKSAREAAELAAMGKISEILGKRSANVSGEVMVEVGSTKQQLKTPWAQKQATHAEAGSEIHRDEVPLMYQPFVEQYFEEIRKAAPAAKTPASKPAPKNPNPGL